MKRYSVGCSLRPSGVTLAAGHLLAICPHSADAAGRRNTTSAAAGRLGRKDMLTQILRCALGVSFSGHERNESKVARKYYCDSLPWLVA